jgi:type II secretion system protein N
MKRLAVAVAVLLVFAAGVVVTFPTGPLVDTILARLPPATARAIERVGSSRLGFRGLTLEDVTLRPRPDAPPLEVRSVSVRPSLLGLVMGRSGRPWQVHMSACDGTATARVDRQAGEDTVNVQFTGIDLAPCLAPFTLRDPVEGRATGDAALIVTPAARTWAGVLTLADAHWLAQGMPRHLALRAEQATLRWRFDDALHVDDFALANDEFTASGTGVVHFPPAPAAPELDLRIHLQPSATMPQAHRDLLSKLPGSPPDATGARTYRIGGPLDAPQIGRP